MNQVSIQPLLLFIQMKNPMHPPIIVSIQPLLLFIVQVSMFPDTSLLFQYNPCYCLSAKNTQNSENPQSFNTTLVTVYLYTSCASFHSRMCFNTTLVTVYPCEVNGHCMPSEFQYNPCYCLSSSCIQQFHQVCSFQYNPCYCLSTFTLPVCV